LVETAYSSKKREKKKGGGGATKRAGKTFKKVESPGTENRIRW